MNKKRICFVAQFPPPIHGLSKAVETLYNSELNEEFDFEKIDIKDNSRIIQTLATILKSKADLFYFTISQSKGGNIRDLLILALLRLQHKECLIHLHGGYYRQLVDADMPGWQRKLNYRLIKGLTGAIVLGPSLRNIFEGMLPDDKIFVVPNCVDDQYLMSDEEFEEKANTLSERKVKHVLYLSNFIRSKGYPFVLEMARLEKERVEKGKENKFHFDFAGMFIANSEKEYFENYIRDNALEDFITYHGIVGGDTKRELLKRCDVFVLPTRYPNEGQPISILEAMGNGMLIISTDHAGIPDIVKAGINGIVIPKNTDAEECFHMMLNQDEQTIMRVERTNRIQVTEMYSQSDYLKNMEMLFSTAIKGEQK